VKKVTVYGAHWCGPCHVVKKYLEDNNVPYDYVDIDVTPEQMPYGFTSIPVIKVGDEYIVGVDKPKLAKALDVG
jgi:glutaredoxin